jgi:hypothetical protein
MKVLLILGLAFQISNRIHTDEDEGRSKMIWISFLRIGETHSNIPIMCPEVGQKHQIPKSMEQEAVETLTSQTHPHNPGIGP